MQKTYHFQVYRNAAKRLLFPTTGTQNRILVVPPIELAGLIQGTGVR
jgi:hypothetical protein